MMLQVIAAFFVTVFFSIMFNSSRNQLVYAGLAGGLGWFAYLLVYNTTGYLVLAFFVGSLLVSIAASILTRIRKAPITVFQIPGIIPLVPGKGMYDTLTAVLHGDTEMVLYHLLLTLEIAGAIAIGMMLVYTLRALVPNS